MANQITKGEVKQSGAMSKGRNNTKSYKNWLNTHYKMAPVLFKNKKYNFYLEDHEHRERELAEGNSRKRNLDEAKGIQNP